MKNRIALKQVIKAETFAIDEIDIFIYFRHMKPILYAYIMKMRSYLRELSERDLSLPIVLLRSRGINIAGGGGE